MCEELLIVATPQRCDSGRGVAGLAFNAERWNDEGVSEDDAEELMTLTNLAYELKIPYYKLKDQQYSNKRFPRAAVVTNKGRGIGTLYRRQEMIDYVDSIGLREQKGLYIHLAIQFVGLKTEYAHLCYKLGYIPQPVLRSAL